MLLHELGHCLHSHPQKIEIIETYLKNSKIDPYLQPLFTSFNRRQQEKKADLQIIKSENPDLIKVMSDYLKKQDRQKNYKTHFENHYPSYKSRSDMLTKALDDLTH